MKAMTKDARAYAVKQDVVDYSAEEFSNASSTTNKQRLRRKSYG